MGYVFLATVAIAFIITACGIWLQRRREAPLRREVRSKDITFRLSLTEVKERQPTPLPRWLGLKSIMALYIRGDAFEISSVVLPFRVMFRAEYYFRAPEATIEVSQEPSVLSKRDWIVVTGDRGGEEVKLAIMSRDQRELRDSWNALAAAGAVPIGPPPGHPYLTAGELLDGLRASRFGIGTDPYGDMCVLQRGQKTAGSLSDNPAARKLLLSE